jgi:hypothetical protein
MEAESDVKVVYRHFRYPETNPTLLLRYFPGDTLWKPASRGGWTICEVLDRYGDIVAHGEAHCSLKDAYCYRIGRDISRGRALKVLQTGP